MNIRLSFPQRILCELGSSQKTHSYLKNVNRLLIVTDSKLYGLGLHNGIVDSLDRRMNVEIYKECSVDPRIEEVEEIVEMYKQSDIECVLGLGGGSCMDVAKVVAYLLENTDQNV